MGFRTPRRTSQARRTSASPPSRDQPQLSCTLRQNPVQNDYESKEKVTRAVKQTAKYAIEPATDHKDGQPSNQGSKTECPGLRFPLRNFSESGHDCPTKSTGTEQAKLKERIKH